MSSITQLPGPGPGAAPPQSASQPTPPTNQVVTVPIVQAASPYWVDPTTAAPVPIPPPPHQIHYYTIAPPPPPPPSAPSTSQPQPTTSPSQNVPSPQQRSAEPNAIPRPRKPYTTTKVREMWSPAEHERMLEGLRLYKRDWAKVTRYVGTRSAAQVRSHAQKYFDRVAREKTDDYVPRARPKRKSATPYPRKVREDASTQQKNPQQSSPTQPPQVSQSQSSPMPMPISIPVQALHHAPQPGMPQTHSVHHSPVPMQIAAAQSPMMSHMHSGSPYLAHPQQPAVQVQQGMPPAVYSPYVTVCAPPPQGQEQQRASVQSSPVPHPSPMSYMSGHSYPGHSPGHPHQQMSIVQSPMYSLFSPLTPGGYPAAVARAPGVNHGQVSVVTTPAQMQGHSPSFQHIPTHSHPNGPMDNCAKCIALRRYGNVLQEIGEIRSPRMARTGMMLTATPGTREKHCLNVHHAHGYAKGHVRSIPHGVGKVPSGARDISESSGRRARDGTSTPSSDGLGQKATAHAADQRARRAKMMKARKAKTRTAASGKPEDMYVSERSSESCSSVPRTAPKEIFKAKKKKEDGSLFKSMKRGAKRDVPPSGSQGEQAPGDSNNETCTGKIGKRSEVKEGRPMKRIRRDESTDMEKKSSEEELSLPIPERRMATNHASVNSSPATRVMCDKSEESGQKGSGTGSPPVETYSPTERKEIFDAVKSLQILAKTSSSPSSSESKPDVSGSTPE